MINSNSIERELGNVLNRLLGHSNIEALPHLRENSTQENESRDIEAGDEAL